MTADSATCAEENGSEGAMVAVVVRTVRTIVVGKKIDVDSEGVVGDGRAAETTGSVVAAGGGF